MPRFNKITERVFTETVPTHGQHGDYEKFLAVDSILNLPESKDLKELKKMYSDIVKEHVDDLKLLAMLEEIIIQTRCKEVIDSELRLSLSRHYIYARSLFYRRGKEINDIRVLVGQTSDYGDDISALINDPNFRSICKEKLIEVMDKEIDANVVEIKLKTLA